MLPNPHIIAYQYRMSFYSCVISACIIRAFIFLFRAPLSGINRVSVRIKNVAEI